MPTLELSDEKFIWRGGFEDKDLPRNARFRWDPTSKVWWTDDERKAITLARFAVGPARARLHKQVEETRVALAQSRATDADVDLPRPEGLDYLPYQKAGISYAMERDNVLIADEMGLGKTIQAIGIANVQGAKHILVICPASLRLNWQREFRKWTTHDLRIGVVVGDDWPKGCDVYVINYDIVERHRPHIDAVEWDLLIADESHYLKNPKAQRTAAVLGGTITKRSKKEK